MAKRKPSERALVRSSKRKSEEGSQPKPDVPEMPARQAIGSCLTTNTTSPALSAAMGENCELSAATISQERHSRRPPDDSIKPPATLAASPPTSSGTESAPDQAESADSPLQGRGSDQIRSDDSQLQNSVSGKEDNSEATPKPNSNGNQDGKKPGQQGALRKCMVVVIGDFFKERYWVKTSAESEPPITSVRNRKSISELAINSGTVLHYEIIKELLLYAAENDYDPGELLLNAGTDSGGSVPTASQVGQENKPPRSPLAVELLPSLPDELVSDGLSKTAKVYLHQLEPYPINVSSKGDRERVWRIAETLGLTESRPPGFHSGSSPRPLKTREHSLAATTASLPDERESPAHLQKDSEVKDTTSPNGGQPPFQTERPPSPAQNEGATVSAANESATIGKSEDHAHDAPKARNGTGKGVAPARDEENESETAISDVLDEWLSEAENAIAAAANTAGQLILVVNDRLQGFRERKKKIESLFSALHGVFCDKKGEGYALGKQSDRIVIVWHPRRPFSGAADNAFFDQLKESPLRAKTIALVNHECLSDNGVNIRFDVAYEHTMGDVIEFSQQHQQFRELMHFAQVLIRYDYGVLHLTTDGSPGRDGTQATTDRRRLIAMDTHGMLGGPFYMDRGRYGSVTGRTFLLVASLVRELVHWCFICQQGGFKSVFGLEGIENDWSEKPQFEYPMGDPTAPSIVRSTPIDRAIDIGILLNAHHFYGGYGPFKRGVIPPGIKHQQNHFKELFKHFCPRVSRTDCDIEIPHLQGGSDGDSRDPRRFGFRFSFTHEEPELTRLSRFSMEHSLLEGVPQGTAARDAFSRVKLLGVPSVTWLRKASRQHEDAEKDCGFQWSEFDQSLRDLVILGEDSVLGAPPLDGKKFLEPSVIVPYVKLGTHLVVLDREEIDGYLSIRFLFERYLAQAQPGGRPLSVGVFGPPGAGKSFAVNEILKSVGKDPDRESMTFNLSQFEKSKDLARAFHRIQDRALANQVPIAFFDEFDSAKGDQRLGWLKYFLAPMQDGEFFDGHETFHVGPAIFVFGGGTAQTFKEFVRKYEKMSHRKAPDFISRLRGHVDIRDISSNKNTRMDERLQVRRALTLRSLLAKNVRGTFDETNKVANIDPDIVNAFLKVDVFKHGKRSMEALIATANIRDSTTFQKSSLPTLAQMGMHVDADSFISIVHQESKCAKK